MVAARLSLNAVELVSSATHQLGQRAKKRCARCEATYAVARALPMASGMPMLAPRLKTVCHCFAASGAGACITAGIEMKDRLAF
jgi:hypothetical protein